MLGEILNKVKTLTTDWTTAKAAFLDVAVSSRAPSNTALDKNVWTDTKAGYLDAAISSISGGGGGAPVPGANGLIIGKPNWTGNIEDVAGNRGAHVTGNVSTYNVWTTLTDVTGSGVINALWIYQQAGGNPTALDVDFRVTIDGNVVWASTTGDLFPNGGADDGDGYMLIGDEATYGGGSVGFTSGFKVEFKKSENTAGTLSYGSAYSGILE